MKLYELDASLRVLEQVVDEGGEISPELMDLALNVLGSQVETKMENIAKLMRNWEGESDAIDAEIKRLRDRKSVIDKAADRLKEYALSCLQAAQMRRIKLPLVTAYIGTTSYVDLAVSPEELPEEFRRIKVEADKTAIKKALDAGQEIPGAAMAEREYLVLR